MQESQYKEKAIIGTGLITTSIGGFFFLRRFRRISNASTIPKNYLNNSTVENRKYKTMFGYVTRVGDGDNFRFYHTPGGRLLGWHWLRKVPCSRSDLSNETISVRLAGIDAPESAHFGKQEQPYALEAKEFLHNKLYHKSVRIIPLKIDRYARLVAGVQYYPIPHFFWKKDIGPQMIRKGLAVVYEGSDGVFCPTKKECLLALEIVAKKKKLSLWSQGKKLILPSVYKRGV
ncbi:mitochondrial nuclease Lcl3, implicated in DNA repair [Schizosaccharomyces pombe]|uniref:Probable endonuclease C19F8.04c n=1 Tax=Schizosaccharomyces pombe (strain 972 / ATCC 24843) TaxID=284812 RepID=LCL3_SCHPO|nr:nuclease [Schizosaccharomyces pombe]O60168.1 RecName: Full=Probable endonuclease C19F8.04c [Schizosaccharomyces pombe 972h-]CAA19124.1 nuclease [Schizosaccharomyces pombe]|eukprot:NP_596346.1 nuclease [Schizosaccharomyces pombe]